MSTDWARRGTVLCALLLAACTAAPPSPGPRFDDESTGGAARELSCMQHQPQAPGSRYTDDKIKRTEETFALLRYYTANGTKPYCDGEGPTATDRKWVDLYVRLGADRKHVAPLLNDEG